MAKVSTHKLDIKREVMSDFLQYVPSDWIPAGSYRREREFVRDFDVLITGNVAEAISLLKTLAQLTNKFKVNEILNMGEKKASVIINFNKLNIQLDLFHIEKSAMAFALMHYTGDKNFNIRTRAHAKRLGYMLNQYGLYSVKDSHSVLNAKNEKDIFKFLGITYKTPKERSEGF